MGLYHCSPHRVWRACSLPAMSQPDRSCPVSVDDSFGPWAGSACRGGFDFTLLFEEGILSIPLSCLFLLLLPSRTLHLVKSDVKILSTPLPLLKLVRCSLSYLVAVADCMESLPPSLCSASILLWWGYGQLRHHRQSHTAAPPFQLQSSPLLSLWDSACYHGSNMRGQSGLRSSSTSTSSCRSYLTRLERGLCTC